MFKTVKLVLLGLLEGLQAARQSEAEKYLSKSISHHDLEVREKKLKEQNLI